MNKNEVLDSLYHLNAEELGEIELRANRIRWGLFCLEVTRKHETHVSQRLLAQGCLECFPNTNGERIGG